MSYYYDSYPYYSRRYYYGRGPIGATADLATDAITYPARFLGLGQRSPYRRHSPYRHSPSRSPRRASPLKSHYRASPGKSSSTGMAARRVARRTSRRTVRRNM